jgi:hypothetical protein
MKMVIDPNEEITLRTFFAIWAEFLADITGRFTERHIVLRAIRIRTACSSPVHRHLRARRRRKIEKELQHIDQQLEQIKRQRANDFTAEFELQKDQALLQSDLINL